MWLEAEGKKKKDPRLGIGHGPARSFVLEGGARCSLGGLRLAKKKEAFPLFRNLCVMLRDVWNLENSTEGGARTHGHKVKSLALYRLM